MLFYQRRIIFALHLMKSMVFYGSYNTSVTLLFPPPIAHFATSPRPSIKPRTYDYGIPRRLSAPLVAMTTPSVMPCVRHLGIEPNISTSPWRRLSVSSIETSAAPSILCPIGLIGVKSTADIRLSVRPCTDFDGWFPEKDIAKRDWATLVSGFRHSPITFTLTPFVTKLLSVSFF